MRLWCRKLMGGSRRCLANASRRCVMCYGRLRGLRLPSQYSYVQVVSLLGSNKSPSFHLTQHVHLRAWSRQTLAASRKREISEGDVLPSRVIGPQLECGMTERIVSGVGWWITNRFPRRRGRGGLSPAIGGHNRASGSAGPGRLCCLP